MGGFHGVDVERCLVVAGWTYSIEIQKDGTVRYVHSIALHVLDKDAGPKKDRSDCDNTRSGRLD